ncbi:MAG: 30S ribosomal protein S2 [Alphaproteobacteria bacterium]|nr:30S ribosomal protein S2 [Alphaproteobacteria bacterium]
MSNVSLRDLLEAGVHFGHQTRLWNPKMKPYIYGEKNGVHIIDLQKTARHLVNATRHVSTEVAKGRTILFVGTKRAAREVVEEEAARCGMYFVNNRWLGGTLTNFGTVKKSIERLVALEKARDEGRFELLTKKEALELTRKIEKMDRSLGGIKEMRSLPGMMFVIDPKREHIAIREARRLGIPVVALCDTNCDPDGISHVIPGNDDALKSIRLFTGAIADAVMDGAHTGRSGAGAGVVAPSDDDLGDVEVYVRAAADDDGDDFEEEEEA